jgi:hypothetical protein
VLNSYAGGKESIRPGNKFSLKFTLSNAGAGGAEDVVVTFAAGDFLPRENGGVVVVGDMPVGASSSHNQPLIANPNLAGGSIGNGTLTITYRGVDGTEYSGQFHISVPIAEEKKAASGSWPTPTPTPTPAYRPQLLIQGYRADGEVLSPGSRFALELELVNVGGGAARNIIMVLGGAAGNNSGEDDSSGDGLSGAGGDFNVFAPLDTSNVRFLGDIDVQGRKKEKIQLIVNTTAKPGAYALRFSFAYEDEKWRRYLDDQVITLLVLSPPRLDISFYRPPDPLFSGQPGTIPLQIVNLGQSSIALGLMTITAPGAQVSGGSSTVGLVEAGGFFSLDVTLTPGAAGPLSVLAEIQYFDDFNQNQIIQHELLVDVAEGMPSEPIPETGGETPMPEIPPEMNETLWQKVVRLVKGLLGLEGLPPQPVSAGNGIG